jgi:O-6-methylguanine DNA methyltransferase
MLTSFDNDARILERTAEKYLLDESERPAMNQLIKNPIDDFLAVMNGEDRKLDLDITGTQLQLMVWDEIKKIPRGKTLTYAGLAMKLNRPKLIQAVTQACMVNPVAVIVPCHRVVGIKDIGGYRWGVERKIELLRREAAAI